MADIYVYITDLPTTVTEVVLPCLDGYTVYLNARMSRQAQAEGYRHALAHISGDDWQYDDVQGIEKRAHKSTATG